MEAPSREKSLLNKEIQHRTRSMLGEVNDFFRKQRRRVGGMWRTMSTELRETHIFPLKN